MPTYGQSRKMHSPSRQVSLELTEIAFILPPVAKDGLQVRKDIRASAQVPSASQKLHSLLSNPFDDVRRGIWMKNELPRNRQTRKEADLAMFHQFQRFTPVHHSLSSEVSGLGSSRQGLLKMTSRNPLGQRMRISRPTLGSEHRDSGDMIC